MPRTRANNPRRYAYGGRKDEESERENVGDRGYSSTNSGKKAQGLIILLKQLDDERGEQLSVPGVAAP